MQSVKLSGSVCSVPTWVFRFYDTVSYLLTEYFFLISVFLLAQDHLREVLMMEQELKTFVNSEKTSTRLPENIISK